jgi:hypothetical protein
VCYNLFLCYVSCFSYFANFHEILYKQHAFG